MRIIVTVALDNILETGPNIMTLDDLMDKFRVGAFQVSFGGESTLQTNERDLLQVLEDEVRH